MDNIKIIVSHNYIPCKEALDYYAGKKQFIHIFASSSVQREDLSKLPSSISFKLDIDCPKSRPDLNWTLCELTNLYAGASLPDVIDAEYIGLCHYRRLFNIS